MEGINRQVSAVLLGASESQSDRCKDGDVTQDDGNQGGKWPCFSAYNFSTLSWKLCGLDMLREAQGSWSNMPETNRTLNFGS